MAKKAEKTVEKTSVVQGSPRNQILELRKVAEAALKRCRLSDQNLAQQYNGKIMAYDEVLGLL